MTIKWLEHKNPDCTGLWQGWCGCSPGWVRWSCSECGAFHSGRGEDMVEAITNLQRSLLATIDAEIESRRTGGAS